jgi:hypothetical protein
MGPSPTESIRRNKYYLSIIDDFSKFIWLFPLNAKSQVACTFINFQTQIERYFDCKIKSVQTDFGGEFQALKSHLLTSGIVHRLSCPHTHEQNGSVERRHRHIVETGLTLMENASVPHQYWDEAFLTATYLINHLPSLVIHHKTPLELLFKQSPDYTLLRTFGCAVGYIFAHITPIKWITAQLFVFFLATALFIEDINVCNNQLAESLSLDMSSSMNPTSHSSKSIPLLLLLHILPQHYPLHSASHSQILCPLPSPFHQPNSPLSCQSVKMTHQKTPHQPLFLSNQTPIP